jgi:pimeloyl-ACP methyl ester carboxylesterase
MEQGLLMSNGATEYLTLPDRRLAYQRLRGRSAGKPGIVFLGGYASDMTGTKAGFLAEQCAKEGLSYLRFDYRGHGQSEGNFRDGTIGDWFADTREVFDRLADGPQILVGSSMGGWLGLMLARERPDRIRAYVGIAAAPDFTEDLMWMRMSPEQRAEIEKHGEIRDPTAPPDAQVPVTLKLIQEARQHLLLRAPIELSCPVHFLQGLHDEEVPWQHTLRIIENIAHDNVRATFIKDGDHRLSRPQDLELLWQIVKSLI